MLSLKLGLSLVSSNGVGSSDALFLDTYSGAAVAYSLRKLASSTTNVIRVRESGTNAEQDFTSSKITDGTLTTFTGVNNGLVPIEYDQSGSGNNLTQTTASNQLQIVNAGALVTSGGLAATQGSSSSGGQTPLIAFSGMTDIWVFAVVDISSFTGSQILFESSTRYDTGSGNILAYISSTGKLIVSNRNGTTNLTTTYDLGSVGRKIISIRMISGVALFSEVYVNGVELTSTTTPSVVSVFTDQILYVSARAGSSVGFLGKLQELILYPSDQSANRVGIETNLNEYYGIY